MTSTETLVRYGLITSNAACAATAFLVWDTLINLDKEVEYIWGGPNNWAKWTYLSMRHMPYLAQGSILTLVAIPDHGWKDSQCRFWIAYQLGVAEVLTVCVEIVLIVRIFAMYNRNWIVVTFVCALFMGEIAAMCTMLAINVPRIEFTPQCLITSTPKLFPSYWTFSLAFETTLFILTLAKFFTMLTSGHITKRSIMLTLMRDGTWAYAIIFVILLSNTLMYEIEKNTLGGLFYFWELSIMSFAGSHLLLNLRHFAMHPSYLAHSSDSDGVPCVDSRPILSALRFVRREDPEPAVIELTTIASK